MYKEFLLEKVVPYKKMGFKILQDGTELYSNDKAIAPQAWLHQLFASLTDNEIFQIENILGKRLPNSMIDFYKEMNGFRLFVRKISIDGLRKNISRNIEAAWQPFSIETVNIKERPKNAINDIIFIGSLSENGNLIYLNSRKENVSICTVDNAEPIKTWKNLKFFFEDEINRIFTEVENPRT